ncbi:MAG: hypothetical protein IJS32_03560, partial [Kiritimatiellae bacterium]|nr:hypothetical protein [Kiritimatiellia bacterium]
GDALRAPSRGNGRRFPGKSIEKGENDTKGASGRLTNHIDAKHWQNHPPRGFWILPNLGKIQANLPTIGKTEFRA